MVLAKYFPAVTSLILIAFAHPTPESTLINATISRRIERPQGIPVESIHGSAFTENSAVDAAVAGAPVWLFGIIDKKSSCYPESGIQLGTSPVQKNPGTAVPLSYDTGDDCTDPGPWSGQFTQSKSFPNYVHADYCPGDASWRVVYNIYYVHDGALGPGSSGHRHDWESATVMWKKDSPQHDWWHRDGVILERHGEIYRKGYGDVQSVDNNKDLDRTDLRYKLHPKAYAGYWKHGNFFDKKTSFKTYLGTEDEFRSDEYYYIPGRADMHPVSEIDPSWNYGDASNPRTFHKLKNGHPYICSK